MVLGEARPLAAVERPEVDLARPLDAAADADRAGVDAAAGALAGDDGGRAAADALLEQAALDLADKVEPAVGVIEGAVGVAVEPEDVEEVPVDTTAERDAVGVGVDEVAVAKLKVADRRGAAHGEHRGGEVLVGEVLRHAAEC